MGTSEQDEEEPHQGRLDPGADWPEGRGHRVADSQCHRAFAYLLDGPQNGREEPITRQSNCRSRCAALYWSPSTEPVARPDVGNESCCADVSTCQDSSGHTQLAFSGVEEFYGRKPVGLVTAAVVVSPAPWALTSPVVGWPT